MRLGLLAALICLACPTFAARLHNFYGTTSIQTKQAFVERLESRHLRMRRDRLVELYNSQWANYTGRVQSFNQLIDVLEGAEFEVRPCEGAVHNFGITSSGRPETVSRSCHPGEWVLYNTRVHAAVFSLWCGNLFVPPPVPVLPPRPGVVLPPPGVVMGIIKCARYVGAACHDQLVIINQGGLPIAPNYID